MVARRCWETRNATPLDYILFTTYLAPFVRQCNFFLELTVEIPPFSVRLSSLHWQSRVLVEPLPVPESSSSCATGSGQSLLGCGGRLGELRPLTPLFTVGSEALGEIAYLLSVRTG
jgi:hypothetical protein